MHCFFQSTFFNFEFLRFGGAEVAECLQAAANNDPDSWHRAWTAQAEEAAARAQEVLMASDFVSTRRAFLRASNYFRASGYMFNDGPTTPNPHVLPIAARTIDHFGQAVLLLDTKAQSVEIPFERRLLPGYLYLPPSHRRAKGKIPVLIHLGGADSIQEELYYVYAATGPDLGYAVLTFDGPGQDIILRRDKQYMRPDWEVVVAAVLDWLSAFCAQHPELELDTDRIGVAGSSMGGYYALRAAADPRVRACVSIDPFYDMWDFAVHHILPALINWWRAGWIPTALLNGAVELASRLSFQTRWEVDLARWFFGVKTPTDTLLEMRKYTLKRPDGSSLLKRVHCPVLVSGAAESLYLKTQADTFKVYNALDHVPESKKSVWIAKEPEDGGLQAKIGAIGLLAQRTFQFLDEQLSVDRN